MSRFDTFKSLINRPILEAIRYSNEKGHKGEAVYEPNTRGRKSKDRYIMDAPDPDTRNSLYEKNKSGFESLFKGASSATAAGNFLFLEVLSALGLYLTPLSSTGKSKGEKSNLAVVLNIQSKLAELENRLSKCFSTDRVPFTDMHYSIIEHILINNKSHYETELGFNTYYLLRESNNLWDRIFSARDKNDNLIHGQKALLKNISDHVIAVFYRDPDFMREKRQKEWEDLQRYAGVYDRKKDSGSRKTDDDWDTKAYEENSGYKEVASSNATDKKEKKKANTENVSASLRKKAEKYALKPEDREKVIRISVKATNLLYKDFTTYRDAGLKPYDVLSIWKLADSIAGISMSLDNLLLKVDKEVKKLSKDEQEDLTVDDYLTMIYNYLGKSLNQTAKNLSAARNSALAFLDNNSGAIPSGFIEGIRDAISTHITEVGRQVDTAKMINNLKRYIRQEIKNHKIKETSDLNEFMENLDTIANRGITKEDRKKLTDIDAGSKKAVENLNALKKIFDHCANRGLGGIKSDDLTLANLAKLMKISAAPPEKCPKTILELSKTITERFKDNFDLSVEDIESFANAKGSESEKNYEFINELYRRTEVSNFNIANRYVTNVRKGLDDDIEKAFSILRGTRKELSDSDYISTRDDLEMYSRKPIVTILQDARVDKNVIELYNGNPEQSSLYNKGYKLASGRDSKKTIGQLFAEYDINKLISEGGQDLKEAVYTSLWSEIQKQKSSQLNKLYVAIASIEGDKDPEELTEKEQADIEKLEAEIERINNIDIRKNLHTSNNIINAYEIATLAVGIGVSPSLVSEYIANIASRIYATLSYLPRSVQNQVRELYTTINTTSNMTEELGQDTRLHSGFKDTVDGMLNSLVKTIGTMEQSVFDPRVFIDLFELSKKWKESKCVPGTYPLEHGNGAVVKIKDSVPVMGQKGKVSAVAGYLGISKDDVLKGTVNKDDIIISYPDKTCGEIRAIFNDVAEFRRNMNPKFRNYIPNPGADNLSEEDKNKLKRIADGLKNYATEHIYEEVTRKLASLKNALSIASKEFLIKRGIFSLKKQAFADALENLYNNISSDKADEIAQTLATQSYDTADAKVKKLSKQLVMLGQNIADLELEKIRSNADRLALNAKKIDDDGPALIITGKSVFVEPWASAIDKRVGPYLRDPGRWISLNHSDYSVLADFVGTYKMRDLMAAKVTELAAAKDEEASGNSKPLDKLLTSIMDSKRLKRTCWGIQSHLSNLIDKICLKVQNKFVGISIIPEIMAPTDVLRYNDIKVPIGFNIRFILTGYNKTEKEELKTTFKKLFKEEDDFIGTEMTSITEEPFKDININNAASDAAVSENIEKHAKYMEEMAKKNKELSASSFLSQEMRKVYAKITSRSDKALTKVTDLSGKYRNKKITKDQYLAQSERYFKIIDECASDLEAINAGNKPTFHDLDGKPLENATLTTDEMEAIQKVVQKNQDDTIETDADFANEAGVDVGTVTEVDSDFDDFGDFDFEDDDAFDSDIASKPEPAQKGVVNLKKLFSRRPQSVQEKDDSEQQPEEDDTADFDFENDEESFDEVGEVLAVFSDGHCCPKSPKIITNRDKFKRGYMIADRRKEDFYRRH